MNRYIDAEYIIRKYINTDIEKFNNSDVRIVLENLKQNILKAPSIDIVRCKECRLNETDDCPMVYYTPLEDGGIETRWWNRPDDFCSWGERRDR